MRGLKYVYHFDELTWMPDIITRPFNEVFITPYDRPNFVKWLQDNASGYVYIWPGVITPDRNSTLVHWSKHISPNSDRAYVIFDNDSDQARFNLEFVGPDSRIKAFIHNDGFTAFYNVR